MVEVCLGTERDCQCHRHLLPYDSLFFFVFIGTKLRSSPVLPSYSQNVFYCRECFLDKGTKHFFFLAAILFLGTRIFSSQ